MDAYRHVPSGDFCEDYDMLVGPDGFECLLTEPEDRNWYRDGRAVVDRLNAQHAELTALRAEVDRLREERRWIPVSERLPENYETVIAAWGLPPDRHPIPAVVYCVDGLWLQVGYKTRLQVTHWQPLPAPPVEEE